MDARSVGLVLAIGVLVAVLSAGVAVATATVSSPAADGFDADGMDQPTDVETDTAWPTASVTDTLEYETTLRQLPDAPGEFEAEYRIAIPDSVESLEIDLESGATVEEIDGFEETGDGRYAWTESSDVAMIRTTMAANQSGGHHAHERGDGDAFLETGEWGVVQVPGLGFSFQRSEPVGIEETVTVDGPGATGDDIAYFGPVTEHERSVGGETIRLAVPDAVTLQEDPDDILDTLAEASERLEIGAQNDETFVVAVPADAGLGPEGVQYGASDAWVSADASLSDPGSVWLHEYVHTRQEFAQSADGTTAETAWLVEGQAEYEAARVGLEKGLIEYAAFSRFVAGGERTPYAEGVLADQTTWADDRTDYVKGRLVYGELDRQLRTETDGEHSLEGLFATHASAEPPLEESAFLNSLESAGGEDIRAGAEQYTQTSATPDVWDQDAHEAAYEHSSGSMSYGLEASSITVGDREWPLIDDDADSTDSAAEPVLAVPAEEQLTLPITVSNDGDAERLSDVTLQANGETVAHASESLPPDESTTERLTWTPKTPGEYTVRVGDETLTVVVRAPSSVAVTDLSLESETLEADEPIPATATIEATDDRPGATLVPFRTASGTEYVPAVVPVGDTTTVSHDLTFAEDGQYEVAAGEESATVTVGHNPPAELESVPGFTAPVVIVGGTLAALVLYFRQPNRR